MLIKFQQAKFIASYAKAEQLPPSTCPEVSFVGRSNVGKSSIMNKIFNRKSLVKTSKWPGSTQHVNFFGADGIRNGVHFVDLPGYGFARRADKDKERWRDLVEGYFNQDRNFALCVVLIDIRHDISPLDIQMVQYLADREVPFMVAFTKADKLSGKAAIKRQVQALAVQLGRAGAGDMVCIACSALNGEGVSDLRSLITDAVEQAYQSA